MIPSYKRSTRKTEQENPFLGSLAESANLLKNATSYNPSRAGDKKYDKKKLKKVGKTQEEQDAEDAEDEERRNREARSKDQDERDAKSRDAAKSARGLNKDSDGGSIFSMLFKIVPIGLNIAKRLPNVGRGLKNIAQGFAEEVVGLTVISIRLFMHHFEHFTYLFSYIFTWIICSIFKIFTLHKCIPFYVLDIILFLLYLLFFSICFLLDILLFIPYFVGFGLVDVFSMILQAIDDFDRMVYKMVGIHPFAYPEWIIKMCYRCELMGDTHGIKRASNRLRVDYTQFLPKTVLKPLGRMAGGVGDIFSVFNV
jgi:hypothetical protein